VRSHEGFWHGNPLLAKKAAPDIAAHTARLLIRTRSKGNERPTEEAPQIDRATTEAYL
jgi:hypothetical protein